MRTLHQAIRESGPRGWYMTIVVTLALAVALLALYRTAGQPLGTAPLTTETRLVPTTGEQGYPVQEFCEDSRTTVSKDLVTPPDSTFAATYNLERTKDGVHEVITVGIYADSNRAPLATHYSADNSSQDGFVSKAAAACIIRKAR